MSQWPHEIIRSCPWYEAAEKFGGPNVNWCEATVCSYFSEPANTWSNLAYIFVGIFIYLSAKRDGRAFLSWFGPSIIITGVFSFTYHMSNNLFSQFFDFFGMYFLLGFLFLANLTRMNMLTNGLNFLLYIGFILTFSVAFYLSILYGFGVQYLVIIAAFVILALEYVCVKKSHLKIKFGNLFKGIVGLVIAESFSILDLKRVMCDPHNHFIQGHALWHVIGAFSFIYIYRYYKQFDLDR
jgi:hypothetical protein